MAEDLRSLARRFGLTVSESAQPVTCVGPPAAEAPGLVAEFADSAGDGPGGFSPGLQSALQSSPISAVHAKASELLGVRCGNWHRNPHVWLLEDVDGILDAMGAVTALGTGSQHSRVVAVDARGDRPAGVALLIRGQAWLVRAERGELEVVSASREPLPLGLAAAAQPSLPVLESPDIAALVGAHPVAEWLLEGARALAASPSLLDRAAAAGLLGRLADAEVSAPQLALELRLGGDVGPAARVRTWAAGLGDALVAELRRCLFVELGVLGDALEAFATDGAVTEEDARARGRAALGLRLRRDELESVAQVLRARLDESRREELEQALFAVDRLGWLCLDALDCVDDAMVPRLLRSVGWRTQRAWWSERP